MGSLVDGMCKKRLFSETQISDIEKPSVRKDQWEKASASKKRFSINSTVEVYFYPPEEPSDSEDSLDDSWQSPRTSLDYCPDEVPFEELFTHYLKETSDQL